MRQNRWDDIPTENISDNVARQVIWGERGTLARFRFASGTHVSAHRHEAEQFTCLLAGSMRLRADGRDFTMRSGDILIVPSQVEHEVWVLEDSEVIDFFAPPRDDWRTSTPHYLGQK